MNDILTALYSIPFAAGMLVGFLGHRTVLLLHCRWLDLYEPLPGGQRHRPAGLSRVWVAGLVTATVLGYVLLQVAQTETHYQQLGADVAACQREFGEALKARAAIAAENDRLSRQQRDYFLQRDKEESGWINRLINPPGDIAALGMGELRRQQWNDAVTHVYFDRAAELNRQIDAIAIRQSELDRQRAANPLPEPACGREGL